MRWYTTHFSIPETKLLHIKCEKHSTKHKQKMYTICFRCIAKLREQLMGILPELRVPFRPFTHTGIDNAGPIQVRVSKGRGNKSYKDYICKGTNCISDCL